MLKQLLAIMLFAPTPLLGQVTAEVATSGEGQSVRVDQSRALDSRVAIDQLGDASTTWIQQQGQGMVATYDIAGADQDHMLAQQSDGEASVAVRSAGPLNASVIDQQVASGAVGEISLLQIGAGNRADIRQSTLAAGANRLELSQLGDGNAARLVQEGAENRLQLTQDGNGQSADIRQMGNGLAFGMTQTGNGTAIAVTQSRQ
jgi:hypothetical protein